MNSKENKEFANPAFARLNVALENGDVTAAFLHAADAGLSATEFLEIFGELATNLARSYEMAAKEVDASINGCEGVVGGSSFERNRAASLRTFAQEIISFAETHPQ